MNELSLFTGAGGGVLGSKLLGHRLVGYVEFDPYCQALIASHIRRGHLDSAPIFADVRAFARDHAHRYAGLVDVVSGGFPCQPFSVAGAGLAEDDPRNMWPATEAVLRVVRPPIVLLENVAGLLARPYFGTILGSLAALGLHAEWTVLGAHDVGAPHRRDRLWILAFSDSGRAMLERVADSEGFGRGQGVAGPPWSSGHPDERGAAFPDALADSDGLREPQPEWREPVVRGRARNGGEPGVVSDARGEGLEGRRRGSVGAGEEGPVSSGGRRAEGQPEPGLGRDADGVADRLVWPAAAGEWPSLGSQHGWEPPRVLPRGARTEHRRHRLKAIGNGQVPACVVAAWHELVGRALAGG